MTDFTRVNNIYYDMNVYNATTTPIQAQINNKLLYPLLNQADNYSVSLAKAKVPLDSIPLTRNNLPLKLYQLGLKIGTTEELAYIRQLGANQDNFVWNCPKGSTTISKYKYSSTGTLTEVSSQDVSTITDNVYNFVVDDYSNLFIIGSDTISELPNKLYIIDETNNILETLDFVNIKHIYIDRGQNLYICDESQTPTVYIYGMINSIGSVNLTQKTTLTTNQAGNPLVNLVFCVADGEIIVGYNQNTITLYNEQYEPQTDIQEQAIKQLQNLANINSTANTYILANSNELDDTIFGVQNQMVYNVNNNTQLTNGGIASSIAIVASGYGFATGTDNYTYAVNYPITSPPASFFNANNIALLKDGCIWSAQKTSQLFAMGTSNLFFAWNYHFPPNTTILNTWSQVGEFQLTSNPTPTAISIDVQSTTNKLVAVGSDNNLYITQNPVGLIEVIFNNLNNYPSNSFIWGLRNFNYDTGNQQSSLLNNFSVWNTTIGGMFERSNQYYIFYFDDATPTLDIYNVANYSLESTHPNLDTNFIGITYLPQTGAFAYQNNSKEIVARNANTLAVLYTIPPVSYTVQAIAELFGNYIAVCDFATTNIYIYNLATSTLINTLELPSYVIDLAVNLGDVENGATTLFALVQTSGTAPLGQEIYKINFTDDTYTEQSSQTQIYTTSRYISQINVHQTTNAITFIEGDYSEGLFNNYNIKTLMQNGGYSSNNIITSSIPNNNYMVQYYLPTKPNVYMAQRTSQTLRWSQITSNEQLKGVSVSRSNQNKLYGLGLDSKIYMGNNLNNSITFSQITDFTESYDYISNTPNTSPLIQSSLYLYGTSSQNLITTLEINDECGAIAKNDVANQYVISLARNNQIVAYDAGTLAVDFTSSLTGAYRIFTKNGSDIDAGSVSIYNMSVLIDSINNAFIEATTKINQALGAGTITTPPSISLNYQSGLCTLSYPSVLVQSANGILFNQSLLNIVYYQSTLDQQSGLYQLVLNPQQETLTQNVKTINKFNQLDKILFRSNTIYVIGAYFGINDSNNIFFDIDCPTTDWIENLDQTLYFQPNFLRTYFLRSNLPLDNIQIQLYYQYRNGIDYELYINNGENVTTKLQFIKKI